MTQQLNVSHNVYMWTFYQMTGQNELIGKFKMVGDVISIRGQDMEYTYISTGEKRY